MAIARYWQMASIFQGKSATTWDPELWIWTVKGRASAASVGFPTHGALPVFDVDVAGELESDANFDIVWEHYTRDTGPGTHGLTQAVMKDMANASRAYTSAIATHLNNQFQLQEIRVTCFDANRKSIAGSNKFVLKTPVSGSSSTAMPPNTALAVSTASNSPTRKGHGRWFLGGLGQGLLATTGTVGTTARTAILNASKSMCDSINGTNQAVVAVVRTSDLTFWDVTGVKIGDELDVQNRRRNQRLESYSSAALANV